MLEIIFRSCLGSRPKLPHVKRSLINCSVKGIKITHVCKGILRPKSHQDETEKLWEQDPPYCTSDTGNEGLQPLQQLQIPLKIIKMVLDPVAENIQYSEERGKKILSFFLRITMDYPIKMNHNPTKLKLQLRVVGDSPNTHGQRSRAKTELGRYWKPNL